MRIAVKRVGTLRHMLSEREVSENVADYKRESDVGGLPCSNYVTGCGKAIAQPNSALQQCDQ